jgi:hypothetical protein
MSAPSVQEDVSRRCRARSDLFKRKSQRRGTITCEKKLMAIHLARLRPPQFYRPFAFG